jgi:DUF4097 and DUF4098 domain-containing protein YvlB
VVLAPFCAASDWNYKETHDQARDFASGGMVHVRLSVGDLHVKRGSSSAIRVHYTIKSWSESRMKEAHIDFDVRGTDANIEFHAPTSGNTQFDVELEVPENTNLDIHQKVGDLSIRDVAGDKDLELGVGDVRVATGRADYRVVRASTSIGDVNGQGYGETDGWLGKTLKYEGNGKYELRAHVSIGDITLDEK